DGGMPNFYAYTKDNNIWIDPLGLDVYKLTTRSDGWYPVYEKGKKDPTSYQKLKKGDTYKFGESKNSATRYPASKLDNGRINRSKATSVQVDANGKVRFDVNGNTIGAGLDVKPLTLGGSKKADHLLETQKIKDYYNKNGALPPGNKTFH
ncbi:Rhs family protein, partial [Cellulophaga geojensis KL-A]